MNYEKALIKKITLRLIPFVMVLYTVAYVDRSAIGFAQLHMGTDIGIGSAAYGFGAGLFFLAYFLFEVPSNWIMPRFGPRKWFVRILVSWGLVTVLMAFARGPNQLLHSALPAWRRRGRILPGYSLLHHVVVSPAASHEGDRHLCHGRTPGLLDHESTSRILAGRTRTRNGRLAVAIHCRWRSRHAHGHPDVVLSPRLAA